MLIPIIKDFNNAFSYLVSNSVDKTKEVFDPVSKSLVRLSESQSDQYGAINDIFKISWTVAKTCFLFLVQTIQYIVSFQWLRDFAYLPVSIPNNLLGSNENSTFIQNFNNSITSLVGDRQNLLQRFLFSNQTIVKPDTGLAISDQSLPYNNFILGLPNVTNNGVPINSWSLSFLSNKWFDPLTVPVNFLSTSLESTSKNISQFSSLPESITSDLRISNLILMCILIGIATSFSSFLNSFFISFPLSLSNLLSLRYLIIQKFWAGCVSILGIVFGEIVFMLFLILPPPFIQITLVYLESVWPYIIGLSLIIFIIFDLISNPYTNTMSLYKTSAGADQISSTTSPLTKLTNIFGNTSLTRFLPKKLNFIFKIFGFSFLLSLTEQSCYFSFFGSLNLSSTGNFLDTYLFAASKSPIILVFSCVGFLIGSFLAIIIYNLVIAKMIFLVASFGVKIRQYNPNFLNNWISKRQAEGKGGTQTNFETSISSSKNYKNNWFFIFEIYTRIKNNIISRLRNLFFSLKSKDSLKSLLFKLKNLIQLLISYLPGGKRIIFFIFPGQAHSYKSDFQNTVSNPWPLKNESRGRDPFSVGFKTEPKNAFLSIETKIENMLRTSPFSMFSSASPSISSKSSGDSLFNNNESSGNVLSLGGSAFYNKIDKILLTCLITLSFTTIPYYSFDYLINSFFGFIPQDQVLNAHSLRVNFPDYTNLLGITLSDNNSVINTDVSLYDRAHFMYGEWPNSFESLNYQGELMWTNLRDHRRQKRTRRSTRLKFKTLKTKISTSWKEFKLSSGFLGSTRPSSFDESKVDTNQGFENSTSTTLSQSLLPGSSQESNPKFLKTVKDNSRKVQESLRNKNNLSNLFYKIFLAQPYSFQTNNLEESTSKNSKGAFIASDRVKQQEVLQPISQTKAIPKNEIMPKSSEETRHSASLNETIKPLSTSTFVDLSGGEKYIKTYPKNWKRVITEKYYQNPIYRIILSNDLKNFLKREPLTQQLTNNQENELYFLRVKMAHYYDSLRFYFTLKEQINSTRPKADTFFRSPFESDPIVSDEGKPQEVPEKIWNDKRKPSQSIVNKTQPESIISFSGLDNQTKDASVFSKRENTATSVEESLKRPPFQFKSLTSMNYRQQFKGTLKTVKQLFAISLPESIPVSTNAQYEQSFNQSSNLNSNMDGNTKTNRDQNKQVNQPSLDVSRQTEQWGSTQENPGKGESNFAYSEPNQPINNFLGPTRETQPVEKSYKYDKYLFNEYSYPKNEFLHEEIGGLTNRKSNISNLHELNYQNPTSSFTGHKVPTSSNETVAMGLREYRGVNLATKNIYNMFGSNDPFYVGWDETLRKFVLTSRILSRSSALNYNTINSPYHLTSKFESKQSKKPKQLDFNNDGSEPSSSHSNLGTSSSLRKVSNDKRSLTNQIKNSNNREKESSTHVPIYSTKDIKKLENKKFNVNQQLVHIYRPYTSWPFFKHQLKNLPNRPYLVLYESYLNILNKRIHLFSNININDIDAKSLTFLYSYSFNNNVKKYVSQLPINIYKQSMRPTSLENLFTPTSNARSSFLWPGSIMPAWEYYFW